MIAPAANMPTFMVVVPTSTEVRRPMIALAANVPTSPMSAR